MNEMRTIVSPTQEYARLVWVFMVAKKVMGLFETLLAILKLIDAMRFTQESHFHPDCTLRCEMKKVTRNNVGTRYVGQPCGLFQNGCLAMNG
jgi:hypothetical protein